MCNLSSDSVFPFLAALPMLRMEPCGLLRDAVMAVALPSCHEVLATDVTLSVGFSDQACLWGAPSASHTRQRRLPASPTSLGNSSGRNVLVWVSISAVFN